MPRGDYLFSTTDWFSVEEDQKRSIASEIDGLEGNRLLNTSVGDLCDYLEKKYRIDVPVLEEDRIVADQKETQLDVSRDPNRFIRDRTRPSYVTGTMIEHKQSPCQEKPTPSRSGRRPTQACHRGARYGTIALLLTVIGTNLACRSQVRGEIDRNLAEIRKYLGWLRDNAESLNKQIRPLAHDRIERRRQKLLADQSLVATLGFPLKERADAPRTFTAMEVRRRITPTMPHAATAPYQPEPMLGMDDYEHILSVMTNMALVMERSPSAFAAMDEEALRSQFLVQLNGHYEGQATGETFNYEGKTDILIRVKGKNIFIAECKYWSGPKKLIDTVNQLLGYASWRDTKVAIIIFNRNKNFSQVLEAVPGAIKAHPNFKREIDQPSATVADMCSLIATTLVARSPLPCWRSRCRGPGQLDATPRSSSSA